MYQQLSPMPSNRQHEPTNSMKNVTPVAGLTFVDVAQIVPQILETTTNGEYNIKAPCTLDDNCGVVIGEASAACEKTLDL